MKKKMISLLLVVALCLTSITAASASTSNTPDDETIRAYVHEQVSESYADYYTIPTMTVTILSKDTTADTVVAEVKVEFTKVLKAESAYDLPYIQGLQAGLAELSDPNEIAAAQSYLNAWVIDLTDNYIGKEQTETANFRVELPLSGVSTYSMDSQPSMQFVDAVTNETLDMDEFAPQTESELYAAGVDATQQSVSAVTLASDPVFDKVDGPSDATDYDRIAARNYAQQYALSYNSAYKSFSSDCANFVSQCIHAGGIETEDDWRPYVLAWTAVRFSTQNMGITEYMVSRSYFFECTDLNKAFAGSILSWKTYGHVGLVDQNDTVTMTYCAHTANEKSASFKGHTNKKAYIPVWDSYAGQYTPQ